MVSLKQLLGLELQAEDGLAGRVSDFLIDERTWIVGYAAVPVGGILSGEHRSIAVDELSLDGKDPALRSSHGLVELAAMSPADLVTKAEEGSAAANDETPLHEPARFMPEPHSPWRSFNAMLGCKISASDGVYGSLDDLLVELDEWRIGYFVGRSYSWKKKSSVLIPTAWVEQVSWTDETVEVTASKEALEREPSYKPTSHTQMK